VIHEIPEVKMSLHALFKMMSPLQGFMEISSLIVAQDFVLG
jgi:hypothetical protein